MFLRRPHHSHRPQNPQSHRQIEARAFLSYVGGREIDGDALVRIPEAGVHERALNPLPAFAHRRIRHPDGDEVAILARVHVHLDIDYVRIDPEDRGRAGAEEGHPNPSVLSVRLIASIFLKRRLSCRLGG